MHLASNKSRKRQVYNYEILNYEVVDGDTIKVYLDLGFNSYKVTSVRLSGIDTPELRSASEKEKAGALLAKEVLKYLLEYAFQDKVELISTSVDMYGRPIGSIYCSKFNDNLNYIMTDIGAAREHHGSKARLPWVEADMDELIKKCNLFLNNREARLDELYRKGVGYLNRGLHLNSAISHKIDDIYDPFDTL
jgi:hypothetical protein